MESEWQSWAAVLVVLTTVAGFLRHLWKKQRKAPQSPSSCGGNCGCSRKWQEEDFIDRSSGK